jgi:ADP-ribose pyrophosphatase
MSSLADYLSFAKAHSTLFVNPPQGGITILLDEDEIREAEKQEAQRLKAQRLPAEWAQVGFAYRDQYVLLLRDAVSFPDGSFGTCIRSVDEDERAPGVVVLPLYQGQVLLIRHFRHGSRTWHLEVPQGFGIPGLTSEESIRLELQEEISATFSRLVSLGQFHPDTSVGANVIELFYADIESYGDVELQEGITELLPTPVAEVERMIRENEITNTFLLVTYTRAKLYGLL